MISPFKRVKGWNLHLKILYLERSFQVFSGSHLHMKKASYQKISMRLVW